MEEKKLTGYPSIDKPWLKYYKTNPKTVEYRDESLFQMLERCNQNRLHTVAIELRTSSNGFEKGITITYEKYIKRIKECARAFKALGVKENEIIPLILPNIPESRILIYALNIVGATVYPISPMLSTAVFEKILSDNNVRMVAVFGGFWGKFAQAIENSGIECIIHINGLESAPIVMQEFAKLKDKLSGKNELGMPEAKGILSWREFIAYKNQIHRDINPYFHKDHIAAIIGTSGTTGTSKGVCLTDLNLNALAIGQELSDHFRVGEVALDALIQSIGYGISTAHSTGCIGCHTILIPELITGIFPEVLCKTKPDVFTGGPVHYINLMRSKEYAEGKVPYVRCLFSGGATLEKKVEKTLNGVAEGYQETAGDKICVRQGYGSTECCGAASACTYGAYKFGSIGIPMANVTIGIFKPGTDEELPYGEQGEICVSGPTVMQGYLNNPTETENVLKRHSDGTVWLHQADLGWCDKDGHLFMTDRIKNIFMRTGFNVHPSKITEFIVSLPEVRECIVVGVPHPDEQMVPVAFVVLEKNAFASDEEAKRYLNDVAIKNLSETDIPMDWFFMDSLLRNMGGKIDSNKLVELCNVSY